MKRQNKDNQEAWNIISKSYQERYSIKTNKFYWGPLCDSEKIDKLLGEIESKNILELGSGAGQNSIYLAKKGAITTAFDISEQQLSYGKKIAEKESVDVRFVRGNYETVENFFEPNTFDLIVSAYALQYCMTVKSLDEVMRQAYKLLKPKSTLMFSVDHPVRDHGYWNKEDVFTLDNYFDRSNKEWKYEFPENGVSAEMTGSFKTVSDYIMSAVKAGFVIENVLEPEPITEEAANNFATKSRYIDNPKENPFSYEHLRRIPGTLIIKGSKK